MSMCQSSDMASRTSTNRYCIELNDSVPKQPNKRTCEMVTWTTPDVVRQERIKSLERSTSERSDGEIRQPRWDGISVWVPNTTASAARRHGQRDPVQRCSTYTAPSLPVTPSPTTTTTTANTRFRGAHLLTAAGSTLAKAWKRRPTKFIRNFSTFRKTTTTNETLTIDNEDQKSATLTICRRCRGRTVNNSRSVGAATISPTATTKTPEVAFPTVSGDLDIESGYLVGRATSNSPNDVISCRTLPSTSPDDVNGGGNDKHEDLVEAGDANDRPRQSADVDVVQVDVEHTEDLLNWKLSLMDRAEGESTTSNLWVDNSSSDEDDDYCAETSAEEDDNPPRGRMLARLPGSEFSFENDFELALEEPALSTQQGTSDGFDVDEVEKLFDAKLDELLCQRCDVMTEDRLRYLSVNDEQFASPRDIRDADSRPQSKHHDDALADEHTSPVITDQLNSSATRFVTESTNLPPSTIALSGVQTTAVVMQRESDPVHVDSSARRRSSLHVSASRTDDKNKDDWKDRVAYRTRCTGTVDCPLQPRFRSRSVPPASGRTLHSERESITESRPDPSFVTKPTSCSRRFDDTLSSTADGDLDNDCRALTWRKLRTAVDNAVVELVDSLLTTVQRVDGRSTLQVTAVDVARLRRRLLRNVRTALWTDSEPAKNNDSEFEHLRKFVSVLLDCSHEDDVHGITAIKKYIMTCRTLQAGRSDDVVNWQQRLRGQSNTDDKEINVFVLRHGVKIDGLHVSVAGRSHLPVNTVQDRRIRSAFCAARRTLKARYRQSHDANYDHAATDAQSKTDDFPSPPAEWRD